MYDVIYTHSNDEIPKDYIYDTETDEFYEYRNPYTGKIIHIAKEPPLYVNAVPHEKIKEALEKMEDVMIYVDLSDKYCSWGTRPRDPEYVKQECIQILKEVLQ